MVSESSMLSFLCLIKMFNVQYHGFTQSGIFWFQCCLELSAWTELFFLPAESGDSSGCSERGSGGTHSAAARALPGTGQINILNYRGIKLTHF